MGWKRMEVPRCMDAKQRIHLRIADFGAPRRKGRQQDEKHGTEKLEIHRNPPRIGSMAIQRGYSQVYGPAGENVRGFLTATVQSPIR